VNTFYCIIGFGLIVWGYHSYKSFRAAQKQELDEIIDQAIYYTAHLTLTKEENGIVYAYDQNGKFAGQGATRDELVAHVKINLPGKNIFTSLEELRKVGFDVK
jgi:hypothetical protein